VVHLLKGLLVQLPRTHRVMKDTFLPSLVLEAILKTYFKNQGSKTSRQNQM